MEGLRRGFWHVERADHREDRQTLLCCCNSAGREGAAIGVTVHFELDGELGPTPPEKVSMSRLGHAGGTHRRIGGMEGLRSDEPTKEVVLHVITDVDGKPVLTDGFGTDQIQEVGDICFR